MEILENVEEFAVQPPTSLTVVVAVNISRRSRYAIKWALEKFVAEGRKVFKMLHVRPCITSIPTPMGNYVPISQVRDDVATAYKNEVEWRTTRMLRPFKEMFSENKVEVEVVVIEADDVALAISGEVAKHQISELVIGASSTSMFTRKLKGQNISSRISECTPSFCTIYVVSKGKLSSVRPSTSETSGAIIDENSDTKSTSEKSRAIKDNYSDTKSTSERSEAIKDDTSDTSSSIDSCSSYNFSSQADQEGSFDSYSHVKYPSLDIQRFEALSTINQTLLNKRPSTNHSRHPSLNIEDRKDSRSSYTCNSDSSQSGVSNYRSFQTHYPSWYSDKASTSDVPPNSSSSECQVDVNFDLERLRVEIRHVRGMFAVAQNETINASRQLKNLTERRMEESAKLKEISLREERARELSREEKEKQEAAKRELELVMECVKKEASRRKEAESKSARDAKEKQKLEKALEDPGQQYMKFKWEEIFLATSSFSDDLRIGMGAYGTVYKCNLQNTAAAVKVLHSKEGHGNKEFQQELEILSKIRHPHLLLLLGACPDQGCLVYEYMENGNLEDRLFRKNNTPPIPWFDRYRIAWEVASALLFLHNSKPKPIIHRDLKPANILLDHNFVSKIGDVGLSTWLPTINSSVSTMYTDSDLVGTLCYIDPEYQRSGSISPKSDVYAFGMVILQLLTAKPALALAYNVETALENGNLMEILDSEAGNWPIEETQELAVMGISCAELSASDRPDLEAKVLPFLEKLKGIADKLRNFAPSVQSAPPNHFICPILKDVMENPCVAADGYTYDRKEIENWLKENEKSPMTNMPLPNKNLIPNYSLLAAIMEWKSKTQ
ncbi:Protein kinase domain [Macleaya cordata]|uniref:RING-type E3 ubiquitin transferase n=1 Tax=Macleaya cordata TaxID=56857 RepID=A0A200Q2H7_MACCD|nr:Protein kinase domain [Macleaya cordata]